MHRIAVAALAAAVMVGCSKAPERKSIHDRAEEIKVMERDLAAAKAAYERACEDLVGGTAFGTDLAGKMRLGDVYTEGALDGTGTGNATIDRETMRLAEWSMQYGPFADKVEADDYYDAALHRMRTTFGKDWRDRFADPLPDGSRMAQHQVILKHEGRDILDYTLKERKASDGRWTVTYRAYSWKLFHGIEARERKEKGERNAAANAPR